MKARILLLIKTTFNHCKYIGTSWLALMISCGDVSQQEDIPPMAVTPTADQYQYQKMEIIGFIHFSVNTFNNKEWGYGDENPRIFNPEELNVEQWVQTAKAAGMKELILTAKHHDGFCLWPSKFTQHSVKNSPYKHGKGDIVKEFIKACQKYGLKAGLYLSPWDRNHKDYGNSEYITYYRNQLSELLTSYGEISEIWFDGANGGTGYYGGANEERRIDKEKYYDWDSTISLVKSLQPATMIFSDAGPDLRWVGNEKGHAGETFWSTISSEKLIIGGSDQEYLNTGDPNGTNWIIGQCDVSIRPGWFYHAKEDTLVKSPQDLVDIYYKSVGRNGVLLINLPPQPNGLLHETDVANIAMFKKIIEESLNTNLALNKKVTSSNHRQNLDYFSPANITDNDLESYWATDDSIGSAELIVDLAEAVTFDRILIQEPIKFGQRVKKFTIQVQIDNQKWQTIYGGTTVGYKRLLRTQEVVTAKKIKLIIIANTKVPAISNFAVFKASDKESLY